MNPAKIWIVDDDRSIRWVLEKALKKSGHQPSSFENAYAMLDRLGEETPELILTDIRMAGIDGIELMSRVKVSHPEIPIIVMTAFTNLDSTVASFNEGAFEFLPKPFDIDEVHQTIEKALKQVRLDEEPIVEQDLFDPDEMVGNAPAMQEAYRAIARLSQSNAIVLITGESGTGKELVANALHRHSIRRNMPFVALNMAALPNELIEAELFGHEKGAFTGATAQRPGRFEQANGGSLFLDEIGDMPVNAQTRLLRVLAEGSFYRIGGREMINVDVRVIAATHQNLEDLVQRGDFREDLYHRLNVIRIHVPALRERKSDIEALSTLFLRASAQDLNVESKVLRPETTEYLESLDWPGNVRQLKNMCHWLTVMAPGREVGLTDLPQELYHQEAPEPLAGVDWLESYSSWVKQKLEESQEVHVEDIRKDVESVLFKAAYDQCGRKKLAAARLVGLGRNTFRRKLEEYGID